MRRAALHLDLHHHVGPIDRRIFGGFVEHLGRCIYGGLFEPGNPRADRDGFRLDVIEALKPLGLSLVRYPGGNFVSSYDWRDGIGPRERRPVRPDLAWKSLEPNHFGTHEFMDWIGRLGAEPYLAVNLGNGTPERAAEWVEYCNASAGPLAGERRSNGRREPWGVRLWALGNEMDGPWQTGHCSAVEYARRAIAAARLMRRADPSIQTVAAGSSSPAMPTYLDWDRQVLELAWDEIDFLAAHHYSANPDHDTDWFLAEGVAIERMLADYRAVIDSMREVKRSTKTIGLAVDEWNVWYRARGGIHEDGRWRTAPPLLEERYNLEDAIVCAQYLAAFIRNADLVKIACLAQLVNVIAPVVTKADGLLIQTIYWPFVLFSRHARGVSLVPAIDSPTYDAHGRGDVPVLDAAASFDQASATASVFLINRDHRRPLTVRVGVAGRTLTPAEPAQVLGGDPAGRENTWETPDAVRPATTAVRALGDGSVELEIPAPGVAAATLHVRAAAAHG